MTDLLTVQMLAKMTGKSERAIYADLARGKWPHVFSSKRFFAASRRSVPPCLRRREPPRSRIYESTKSKWTPEENLSRGLAGSVSPKYPQQGENVQCEEAHTTPSMHQGA